MTLIPRPNAFVTVEAEADVTKLSFGLQINPAPFTVSIPGQDPVLGSLEFVITNPTTTKLSVNKVEFTFQVGPGASLTPTTAGIATAVSDPNSWKVVAPSPVTSGPATYTLEPQFGSSVSLAPGASVVVQIFQIQTNTTPGNSTILITETINGSAGLPTSFMVTTFPTGFYFNGLAATVQSGSALVPVAQVTTGDTVTLVWNSSVVDMGSVTIYYSDAALGQQRAKPTVVGEWISPPLTSDTVFTVVVQVSMEGGQPLTASLSTAVSVQNPTLFAAIVNTSRATVNGPATITGLLTADAITGTRLTVNGPISATGQASLATTTVSGTLSVTGQTTLGQVSIQALYAVSLNVLGNSQVGSLTATTLTANNLHAFNAQIQFGQNFGVNVSDAFNYNNQNTGWYSVGWFNDSWFQWGQTAWFSGYGGIKFFTGGAKPAFTIDYHANCRYYGSMAKASSIALKENIRSLTTNEASDILNNLEPVRYTRKAAPDERPSLGFIAEHVPSSVASADGKAIIPDEIVAVLTRVLKDQQRVIQKLERKVNALEAKNNPDVKGNT